jgi:hypothetical protein
VKAQRIGRALFDAFSADGELGILHLQRCKRLRPSAAERISQFLAFRPSQILHAAIPRQDLDAVLAQMGPFDPSVESEECWVVRGLDMWLGIFVPEVRDDETEEESDARFDQVEKQPFSNGGTSPYSRSDVDVGFLSGPNAARKMSEYLLACHRAIASKRPMIVWSPNGSTIHASWPCRSLQVISVTLATEAAFVLFPDFCATALLWNGRRRLVGCERGASRASVDRTRRVQRVGRRRFFFRIVAPGHKRGVEKRGLGGEWLKGIFALQHKMCIIPKTMLDARGDTPRRCARIVGRGWGVLLATARLFHRYIGRKAPFVELELLREPASDGLEEKVRKAGAGAARKRLGCLESDRRVSEMARRGSGDAFDARGNRGGRTPGRAGEREATVAA